MEGNRESAPLTNFFFQGCLLDFKPPVLLFPHIYVTLKNKLAKIQRDSKVGLRYK